MERITRNGRPQIGAVPVSLPLPHTRFKLPSSREHGKFSPGESSNVPSRTSLNMEAETTLKLSHHSNIIGVKEASSDLDQITEIISNAPEGFKVWSGNDNETFLIMMLGGYGVVSVASNIIGDQVKHMMGLILEGDIERASSIHKKLLPLFKALFWVTNPIPVKYALNKKGFPVGGLRLPMVAPDNITNSGVTFDHILDDYDIDVSKIK